MKKAICLTLAALTLTAALTGCSGMAYTEYGRDDMPNGYGNVSSSRDGTVNGVNRGGSFMTELTPNNTNRR